MIEALRRLPDWYGYLLMVSGWTTLNVTAIVLALKLPRRDHNGH